MIKLRRMRWVGAYSMNERNEKHVQNFGWEARRKQDMAGD
jgi:hypothetical protein